MHQGIYEETLPAMLDDGAFHEAALTETDAVAAAGDQDELQEGGPTFLDDQGPQEPPEHVSTVRLYEVLVGLSDADLAIWPARLAAKEVERRRINFVITLALFSV